MGSWAHDRPSRRETPNPAVGLLAISEIPQSRSVNFPTPGVLVSLVRGSFRSVFSGLCLVGA